MELNGANLPPLHPGKLLSWCGLTQAFIFEIFSLPTTHTSVVSLWSTTSSENWGSDALNWEGQPLWSFFFGAAAACSGFLRNGQCSELQCLDEADNQLCGWSSKCFFELGKWRLILAFDIPVSSFIDYCSFWSLRIILGNINQSQGGTNPSHNTPFILFPFFIFSYGHWSRVCLPKFWTAKWRQS